MALDMFLRRRGGSLRSWHADYRCEQDPVTGLGTPIFDKLLAVFMALP
jgi:hypothetical protein